MTEQTVTVLLELEARSAALFVQTASKFTSKIQIKLQNKTVNAKSIMGVISLGVREGDSITLTAEGSDSEAAIAELSNILLAK